MARDRECDPQTIIEEIFVNETQGLARFTGHFGPLIRISALAWILRAATFP